jgi:hypothetical protein
MLFLFSGVHQCFLMADGYVRRLFKRLCVNQDSAQGVVRQLQLSGDDLLKVNIGNKQNDKLYHLK